MTYMLSSVDDGWQDTAPAGLQGNDIVTSVTVTGTITNVGSKENVRRQIGMAVPSDGARIIFESILKTLAGIEYDGIPCNIKFDNKE